MQQLGWNLSPTPSTCRFLPPLTTHARQPAAHLQDAQSGADDGRVGEAEDGPAVIEGMLADRLLKPTCSKVLAGIL